MVFLIAIAVTLYLHDIGSVQGASQPPPPPSEVPWQCHNTHEPGHVSSECSEFHYCNYDSSDERVIIAV